MLQWWYKFAYYTVATLVGAVIIVVGMRIGGDLILDNRLKGMVGLHAKSSLARMGGDTHYIGSMDARCFDCLVGIPGVNKTGYAWVGILERAGGYYAYCITTSETSVPWEYSADVEWWGDGAQVLNVDQSLSDEALGRSVLDQMDSLGTYVPACLITGVGDWEGSYDDRVRLVIRAVR